MHTASPPHAAPAERRLTRGVKLAYGFGDSGGAIVTVITGFFLQAFLLDIAGLRPAAIGIIFLIAQVWDAVTDPAMGMIADRTRTRWGSKRPWLLFGAVPFGLAYFLQWIVPDVGPTGLFLYYLFAALLLRTTFTIIGVPYSALTPALTRDYDERTHLNTYRFSFSILAGLVAIIFHPLLVGLAGGAIYRGYLISAGVWAVVIALAVLTVFRFSYELPPLSAARPEPQFNIVQQLGLAFRNRPFLYVTGIYLFSWVTLLLVQSNLLLFTRYWAQLEAQFTTLILTFQVTTIIFLSIWNYLSARMEKQRIYVSGVLLWIIGLASLYVIPPGAAPLYYAAAAIIGAGAAVAYLIPWSMLPDVIEYDELQTGQRREGLFYGMFVFLQKIGLSLGLVVSNFALEAAGYVNPDIAGQAVAQPDSVLAVLRVLVSFVPVVLLLLSVPLALRYPISRARFADIRRQLAERAAAN